MKKKAERMGWAVLVFILAIILTGCGGGGSGSSIQSEPLTPADRPVVVSGLDQQPTNGPTGTVSFGKIHVYDAGSAPVKSVAKTVFGGGGEPVDYLMQYRQRVANIGLTFWDLMTGEWRYSFPFAVVNGDVIPRVEGIIPGAYRITGSAASANGTFTFFSGETTVTVEAEKENHARLVMEPHSEAQVIISVKDMPRQAAYDFVEVQTISTTASGDTFFGQQSGYLYSEDGKFSFAAEVQIYPNPAIKLQYSVKEIGGKIYVQEFNFYILDFIDNVIANGRYDITYIPATNLTIDIVWAPAYTVSLTPAVFNGVRPIVAGNNTGIEMLFLDIATENYPVALQKIDLGAVFSGATSGISSVTIFDGHTIIGSGVFMNGSGVKSAFIFNSALQIPAYSVKTLIVMPVFSLTSLNDDAGNNVRLKYLGSSGVNEATGEVVEDKTPLDGQITADVFKSLLTVSASPLPTKTLQNGTNVLYRFADSAYPAGDIDVYRNTFRIARSDGILINNLRLVDEATGVSIPLTDANSGGEYGFNFEQIKTIAAGAQKSFAFMAEVSGVKTGTKVVTEMLGDQDTYKNLTIAQVIDPQFVGETNNNFVWSDRNKIPHGLNSQDWHNGALVDGFPLAPAILTR